MEIESRGNDLTDIQKADIAKIHAEINQILNQRYSFITTSMTVFGFFLTAIIFRDKINLCLPNSDNTFLIAFAFIFILGTINYFIAILTRQYRMLRQYLVVNGYSVWEISYGKFNRNKKRVEYTESLRLFLFMLGCIMAVLSIVIQYGHLKIKISLDSMMLGPILHILLIIFYGFFIFYLSDYITGNSKESQIKQEWDNICNS